MATRRLVYRLLARRNFRRQRIFRDRLNPMDLYNDFEMWHRFRFHRQEVLDLTDKLSDATDHPLPRKGSLPPVIQILVALRFFFFFFATGSFQVVIADTFGIDRATVSRIIKRVSRALSATLHLYVCPQTREEQREVMNKFYTMGGFPNVVGCVDCTHVNITALREHENVYVDRKGNHSINAHLVCDADLVITDCVANWPGSVHDSTILAQSPIYRLFEQVPRQVQGLLLGDSGYALSEWLMTPFINPNTRAKEQFNFAHRHTRHIIERCNGVLKKRWHCLKAELN